MPPVKEMALAEFVLRCAGPAAQAGARVEETIADVDGPDHENLESENPQRQARADDPGKGQRPDGSDGWASRLAKCQKCKAAGAASCDAEDFPRSGAARAGDSGTSWARGLGRVSGTALILESLDRARFPGRLIAYEVRWAKPGVT